jgi:hypothetical protein
MRAAADDPARLGGDDAEPGELKLARSTRTMLALSSWLAVLGSTLQSGEASSAWIIWSMRGSRLSREERRGRVRRQGASGSAGRCWGRACREGRGVGVGADYAEAGSRSVGGRCGDRVCIEKGCGLGEEGGEWGFGARAQGLMFVVRLHCQEIVGHLGWGVRGACGVGGVQHQESCV